MPGSLTKAGKAAAKAAALAFLAKYKAKLVKAGVTPVRQVDKQVLYVDAFFKGKEKITNLVMTPFTDPRRGCETATVTLHPHPDWKDKQLQASKTLPDVPQALDDIRKRNLFPNEQFISGHMINANFGGDHTDPGNQTVLTVAANGQHGFDDAMKAAAMRMGKAMWLIFRASHTTGAKQHLNTLYKDWRVKIDVTVGTNSWLDVYNADQVLQHDATVVANQYPLNAVATRIVFTAKADGTPTASDIAKNFEIHENKMSAIADAIAEFNQFMDEAASFELSQPAPAALNRRSAVATTMTPLTGTAVAYAVPGTHLALQPKKKKGGTVQGTAAPSKPVSVKVPCRLTCGTATIKLAAGADNEIGKNTPGSPWQHVNTSLTGDPIFYITTANSPADGPAWVSREPGVKTQIEVAGVELGKSGRLPVRDGQTITIYDKRAPNQYYDLTFEQQ